MAFCAYCGKQIADGQVCDCEESRKAANSWQPQQNMNSQGNMGQQMYYQSQSQAYGQTSQQAMQAANAASQAASQAASKAGNILTETFGHLLLILKAPVTAGRNFVVAGNVKVSCAMLLLQGVIAGLFSLLLASKVNSLFSMLGGGISGLMGGSGTVSLEIFSKGKSFFITLLMSIVFALIYALLSWAIAAISSGKTTFSQMLAVAGVRASVAMPVTIVSIILFFINPVAGLGFLFIGGTFLTAVLWVESLNSVAGIKSDIKIYLVALAMIIFCGLCIYLTVKIAPQTISSYYLKLIGSVDFKDLIEEALDDMGYYF